MMRGAKAELQKGDVSAMMWYGSPGLWVLGDNTAKGSLVGLPSGHDMRLWA